MRRTLALAAIAAAVAFPFAGTSSAAPACDVAGNCVCAAVNGVLAKAGQDPLGCA